MSGGMSVLRADDGLYRLCYKAGPDQHSFGCYAESRDGITWTRPSLGLFEVAGTRDNNVILPPEIGDNCAGDFSPFEDTRPGVPPDQRYKGISGMTGRVSAFASPDGIQWRKLVDEPVIEGYDSQHMAFWDVEREEYRSYCRHRRIAAYQAGLDELGVASVETDMIKPG